MTTRTLQFTLCTTALLIAGCQVGPRYVAPNVPAPPAYKEAGPNVAPVAAEEGPGTSASNTTWQQAKPSEAIPRGAWWTIFNDPELNKLEPQVETANQTLAQADANLTAARAEIRVRNADRFPTIGTATNVSGERYSDTRPYFNPTGPNNGVADIQLPLEASYEVDLWGAIHRNIAAGREEAQATAADRQNILLSLQAELALDYFNLRIDDSTQKLLNDTVSQYQNALRITTNRYQGGLAVKSDVTQAETQLEAARVEASDIGIERAQYEHAIANLIGQAPASLSIPYAPMPVDTQPPVIPTGLPSSLLQRRPDIAAAERRAAEGNEAIGIAQSAFYPSLDFNAAVGLESTALTSLFNPSSVVYSLGPGLAETFFDAGRRRGLKQEAVAVFNRDSAAYKQTVLTAFQQVEDNLVALRVLQQEATQQHAATASARESERIFNNRYVGGVDTYLQVITAQTTALNNERNDIDILRRRMDATVLLIKVLGGGWDRSQLPPS
ncbi:MAG TPA: efflux transporter outer membrane subunit [Candidatus Aquilonibacter sp.]|nr:efflux transporter outer membrane subunit [Candidatus Aquilonibacter sp.]